MYGGQDTEGSFRYKILNRLDEINREVDSLKRRREQVDREIARLRGLPARGETEENQLIELDEERHALTHLIADLEGHDTLNLFTDEGLLPNYAFPEQGVTLRSIIFRNRNEGYDGKSSVLTLEYDRPAASAISELAPGSTFYAEGRKVVIDQVDVSRSEPESWRFCRQCTHSEPAVIGQLQEACPRCGDPHWSDAGRLRTMLRLKQVYAHSRDSESRISDDADDREKRFFTRQALVDHDPATVRKAYRLNRPEFPFSFEFLDRITFKEINFGERGEDASAMMIAGEELPRPGFRICRKCGTIQKRRRPGEESRNHALFCPWRQTPERNDTDECLFLYREFSSEAIRMLLPISSIGGSTQRIQSFIAALQLGLIKRFSGAVDHLRVARQQLLAPDSGEVLHFLVIYDCIPGGTGYLKQLMRDSKPLFEVLQAALKVLDECSCNADSLKDGCYRCLFAYRNNFDRPDISREIAKRLIREIVDYENELIEVDRIESSGLSSLHESELERRFIEALRRPLADRHPCQVRQEIVRGKPGYLLTIGLQNWRIEPQVTLGEADGVMIPSRADFVFWPAGTGSGVKLLPIVVFTDGWSYHHNKIGLDLAQRMAIAKSGRYLVWSLSWDDVERILSPGVLQAADDGSCLADMLAAGGAISGGELYQRLGIANHMNFHTLSSFIQLRALLEGIPPTEFSTISRALLLRLIARDQQSAKERLANIISTPPADSLAGVVNCALTGTPELAGAWLSPDGARLSVGVATDKQSLTLEGEPPAVVFALKDMAGEDDTDGKRRWRNMLLLSNLFLPLAQTWCCSTGGEFDLVELDGAPVFESRKRNADEAWGDVYEFVLTSLHVLLDRLRGIGADEPAVGYELLNDARVIIAEAEIAWPDRLFALVTDERHIHRFSNCGWKVFYWVAAADQKEQLDEIVQAYSASNRR
jgi:DEAD/DEAH box helicase domain-containing protein